MPKRALIVACVLAMLALALPAKVADQDDFDSYWNSFWCSWIGISCGGGGGLGCSECLKSFTVDPEGGTYTYNGKRCVASDSGTIANCQVVVQYYATPSGPAGEQEVCDGQSCLLA